MKNDTDHLIKQLTFQLNPVKTVKFHITDIIKVVAVGFFCVFAAIANLGLRVDIGGQVLTTKFVFETAVLLLLSLFSIMAAFSLSVPSMNSRKTYQRPLFVFLLILATTGYSFLTTSNPFLYLGHGFSCVYEILSISLLPAAILFYLIRRAAVLQRDTVGILILMSGVSFGLLGVQFTCADNTPMHILSWHIVPTVVVMMFGVWLARRIIKKI